MENDKQLIYEQYLAVTENTRQIPVVDSFGTKRWYNENGKRHREDGPAVERADGTKFWIINGKKHREDGPAVERPDGSKSWYINDSYYNTIPEWVEALFEFKEWTPEFLASKGKDYDKLVNIYIHKMFNDYGQ